MRVHERLCYQAKKVKQNIYIKIGTNAEMDSTHGCLAITDAKETDGGSYMCAIYNGSRRFLRRTTIVVKTPPVFTRLPQGAEVDAGAQLFLHCQATGTPIPEVTWAHNGFPLNDENNPRLKVMGNGTLHVSDVARSDGGVYQCFVKNGVGQNETTVLVTVNGGSDEEEEEEREGDVFADFYPASAGSDFRDLKTAPPSRPNVTQISRTSALLTWTAETGPRFMPVQFFKVQFREFRRGGARSDWRTLEEVIGPRSRSFEVLGLADDVKYRFRIVAVFADDDNRHGDLSKRFRLDPEYDTDRAPRRSPTITQVILSPKLQG